MIPCRFLFALAVALPMAAAVHGAAERTLTEGDRSSLALTIYGDDLALVKDARAVRLEAGASRLVWEGLGARLRPETAQLRAHPAESVRVREQGFELAPLTPARLLEMHVGRAVSLVRTHPTTGAETVEPAELLAAGADGVVLRVGDRIETQPPGRIVYPAGDLRARPALVLDLDVARQTERLELSYLTGGLSWQADYVAELGADARTLDLAAWATITNASGASYPQARVQLVAGEVHRVRDEAPHLRAEMATLDRMAPAPAREALQGYHLYTLPDPVTLEANEAKQAALLDARGVAVERELLVLGGDHYYRHPIGTISQKLPVAVYLGFVNAEAARLGRPLPRGIVRVYQKDARGQGQFLGEDRIAHTAVGERVRINLGQSFDVTAERRQSDFRDRSSGNRYTFESAYEITLRNATPAPAVVTVREPIPGDWTLLEESQPHAKVAAGAAQWQVAVPAAGSATLRYRVLVRY